MSYVIKNMKKNYWLGIDRVINNSTCDITTVVEPIYSYKAATKFDTEEECTMIMKELKESGNPEIKNGGRAYLIENVEELLEAERKAKEAETKNISKAINTKINELIEMYKAQGMSEEDAKKQVASDVINNGICINQSCTNGCNECNLAPKSENTQDAGLDPKLFERPDMAKIKPDESFVIGGWMDWSGGEQFIKKINLSKLNRMIIKDTDPYDIIDACIELTDDLSNGGFKDAKLFSEADANYILGLLNDNGIHLGENDNFALNIPKYIEYANEEG